MAHAKLTFGQEIGELCKARFPCIYVQTWEEERVLAELAAVATDRSLIRTPRRLFAWSATTGLVDETGTAQKNTSDPQAALRAVEHASEPALFVLKDFHVYFGGQGRAPDHLVIRKLRDILPAIRGAAAPVNVIFVSPLLVLPQELQKDISVVEFDLPGDHHIRAMLDQIIDVNQRSGRIHIDLSPSDREQLVKAAQGLTLLEAENAFARAMVGDGRLDAADIEVVLEEKRQVIRKTEILEFIQPRETFDDVGGLQNLRRWLVKRQRFWSDPNAAAASGLPFPKGILITGVPGCGKSLTAKCTSSLWQLPLLRLDIGRIFSGLVGSSEENMRSALRTAEAIAPCILWIDEIEKGFSGSGAGAGGDSGTSSRVFGTFLTWMQEKTRPVFVIATANSIDRLPPEFLRKGRFDEIFFTDLPTPVEREQILRVHVSRRVNGSSGPALTAPESIARLAETSEGYNGAELEQAVIGGLFEAFAAGRDVTLADFEHAIKTMVPLSVTQAEQIRATREWANLRAVAATAQDDIAPAAQAAGADPRHENGSARGGRAIDF